jgi:hypothetical protein
VTTAGTPSSDRTCGACASGTYSSTANLSACLTWSTCTSGQFEEYAGSATANRACTWVREFGTASMDQITGTAVDASGNIIVVGYTQGALPTFTNLGMADGFVRKYDPTGTVLWTDQFGGTGWESTGGVAVDASGNIFVTGTSGSAFGNQTLSGFNDIFVRKYNATGTAQWTKEIGNTSASGSAYGAAIAVDATGNIYIGGSTNAAFVPFTQGAIYDGLLLKLDATGAKLWVQQIPGSGSSPVYVNAVTTDAAGTVYVAGSTQVALPGQTLTGGVGQPDAFVQKYTSAGAVSATSQFGTGSPTSGNGLVVDASGNVYVVGQTYVAFPGYTHYGSDGFVKKFDPSLSPLWLKEVGASAGANVTATGDAITIDSSGNLYVAGTVNGVLTGQTNAGGADVYVRSYDTSGAERWTHELGSAGAESVTGVGLDASGRVFVGGHTAGTWATQPTNAGGEDTYVVRVLP